MDGRQIVLVLTAKFSVLNTEIFQLEALSRFTVFTQLQSRMSSCLSSTSSPSKILFLPTYVIYLFTLIYLDVVWSLKNLFFTADIITIYYFNSILYYMLYAPTETEFAPHCRGARKPRTKCNIYRTFFTMMSRGLLSLWGNSKRGRKSAHLITLNPVSWNPIIEKKICHGQQNSVICGSLRSAH